MKRLVSLLLALICGTAVLQAQELEYQMEIGGALGLSSYVGDASSNPFSHPGLMGGAVYRRNFNPRMVLKADLAMGHISGNSKGTFVPVDAYSPTAAGGALTQIKFQRNVMDLGAQFEFNFWGYGTGEGYKGHSRITPYATAGVGVTLVTGHGKANGAMNVPVGAGVKYKVKPRLNVGFEWTMRFTTSDALDKNNDFRQLDMPYGIKSTGIKNKDCYSFCMLFLTYDICPKYRKCNND